MPTTSCRKTAIARVAVALLAVILALAATAPAPAQTKLIDPVTKPWKYSADNSDQYAAGFPNVDDSAWPEGFSLFGNDVTVNYSYPFVTTVLGSAADIQTSYYRTHFNWAGATAGVALSMTNMIDDGIAIYLNGTEIVRWNINAAALAGLAHSTMATSANPGGEPVIVRHFVELDTLTNGAANPLRPGDNVLAVSVHQAGTGSSDSVFGLSVYTSHIPPPPCVRMISPPSTNLLACRSVTFRSEPPPDPGFLTSTFQWYRDVGFGEQPIPGATGTSLTLDNLSSTDAGQYFVRAGNSSGTCDSPRSTLTVQPDLAGPRVVSVVRVLPKTLLVTFDEPFLPVALGGTADDPGTWNIRVGIPPATAIPVVSAASEPDHPNQVRLTIESDFPGGSYETILPIADACSGATTPPGETGPIFVPSYILHWTDGRDWRFDHSGVDQGTAWRLPNFDDSTWELGRQGFGNETANFPDAPDSLLTPLSVGTGQTTSYFRTRFRVPFGAYYRFFAAIDDGAVIYVNGVEIGRINMPSGPVTFSTLAPAILEGQGYLPADGIEIPNSLLTSGDNVLAIEVHQSSATSSDVLLLAKITGYLEPPPPPDDIVFITQPVSLSVVEGRPFTLNALATPVGAAYQWTKDGVPILGATSASYTTVASEASAGVYRVAVSTFGAAVTSDPATVVVRRLVAPYDATWKYETRSQDSTLAGTPWYAPAFDDAAWPSGPGLIGIESTAATLARVPPFRTSLPGPTAATTTYFRSTVTVPALAPGESLFLSHVIDDGAVFYVDGALAFSYNMPGGRPLNSTRTEGTTPGDGDAREITAPIVLSSGSHTIAVEVHQVSTNSDIVFGVELTRGPALPALRIAHESSDTIAVTWTPAPGVRLLEAGTATGLFVAVPGNPQGNHTVRRSPDPARTSARFFRLGY